MKRPLLALLLPTLLLCACNTKTQQYNSADGTVQATYNPAKSEWHIADSTGREPVEQYDSMRVTEVSEDGHPMTVIYYRGAEQHMRQYYSNMQLRGEGMRIDGLRQGRWVYYHPNGNLQVETNYVDGKEEGPYRVYRESGAPYYIGQYQHGEPTGLWEVYDPQGNLVERTEY